PDEVKDSQVRKGPPKHNLALAVEGDTSHKSHQGNQEIKLHAACELFTVQIHAESRGIDMSDVDQQHCRHPGPVGSTAVKHARPHYNRYQKQRDNRAPQEYSQVDISREKPGIVFSF